MHRSAIAALLTLPPAPRRFVHGEEGLQQALKTTEALRPGSTTQLDVATLEDIASEWPPAGHLQQGMARGLLLWHCMIRFLQQ